ncbi:MAG: glycosyltransferase family 4 protein [Anaeromyxobacteraceae bacterium]
MKIGIVTEEYRPAMGGLAAQVQGFAREARRLGHQVRIVTGGGPLPPGVERPEDVIRIGTSRTVLARGALARRTSGAFLGGALRDVLGRERFDVIHVHAPLSPVLPLLAVHHAPGPVVGTLHPGAPPRRGLAALLAGRTLQRHLDRLDAALAPCRAALGALGPRLQAEVKIVPGGVDADRFARGRRQRVFADGRINLLWVGTVQPKNGLAVLLAAYQRAARQVEGLRLLVVGDGPWLARARAAVAPGDPGEVVFAGRVPDDALPDWYASADVFCAPSQAPSTGVTLLEAMAAGRPLLASDVDGYRELVQHGREGELLRPADVNAWARAILRMAREPARRVAYGERGRREARRLAWPGVAREILGVYRAIGVRG